jgi:hypothetical protein
MNIQRRKELMTFQQRKKEKKTKFAGSFNIQGQQHKLCKANHIMGPTEIGNYHFIKL